MKRKLRKFLVTLSIVCLMASNMSVLAAEPANDSVSTVDENVSTSVAVDTVDSSVTATSLLYPSGRILGERALTLAGKQMTEVTFATESGSDTVILPRSIYGYAADYTDHTSDTFTVNAPGSSTSTGHATIKTSDFGSSTQVIIVSIYRPDGTLAKGNIRMTGNQEKVVSFSNAQPGNYTVGYAVDGTFKGWIHCWIY